VLPVRKKFMRYLPVRWCKKVENHWFRWQLPQVAVVADSEVTVTRVTNVW